MTSFSGSERDSVEEGGGIGSENHSSSESRVRGQRSRLGAKGIYEALLMGIKSYYYLMQYDSTNTCRVKNMLHK
jgi:hypothetical protein